MQTGDDPYSDTIMLLARGPPRSVRLRTPPPDRASVTFASPAVGGAPSSLEFLWMLAAEADDTTLLSFGFPDREAYDPLRACVQIRALRETGRPIAVQLSWVGFNEHCCQRHLRCGGGGSMARGAAGVVPMLQGALVLAVRLEPFKGLAAVSLMDVSHRTTPPATAAENESSRLCCSDIHILKDPHHRGWYERHFGAQVCPEKAKALAAIRKALGERVACSSGDFMHACRLASADCGPWFASAADNIKAAFAANKSGHGRWGGLLRDLLTRLWPADSDADAGSPCVVRMLAAIIGTGVVCPRWASVNGWTWEIPVETINTYPVTVHNLPSLS
jgi:hypothetical protein